VRHNARLRCVKTGVNRKEVAELVYSGVDGFNKTRGLRFPGPPSLEAQATAEKTRQALTRGRTDHFAAGVTHLVSNSNLGLLFLDESCRIWFSQFRALFHIPAKRTFSRLTFDLLP